MDPIEANHRLTSNDQLIIVFLRFVLVLKTTSVRKVLPKISREIKSGPGAYGMVPGPFDLALNP